MHQIPARNLNESSIQINGANLTVFHWPAIPEKEASDNNYVSREDQKISRGESQKKPDLLFLHATGFHARCWDVIINQLPEFSVYAIDQRGHGKSQKKAPHTWIQYELDAYAITKALKLNRPIGIGHSMGGFCLAGACARDNNLFSRLLLIDPVILPPEAYSEKRFSFSEASDHPVAKRKNRFPTWTAFFERIKDKSSYKDWDTQTIQNYCKYGLEPFIDSDGSEAWKLACPPEVEAGIYMGNSDHPLHGSLPKIYNPVRILRAPGGAQKEGIMDFRTSPTWTELVNFLPNATEKICTENSHFIPMESPQLVSKEIRKLALLSE